jgi:hypothetical protein
MPRDYDAVFFVYGNSIDKGAFMLHVTWVERGLAIDAPFKKQAKVHIERVH